MNTALRVESVAKQYRMYDHPGDRLKEMLTRGLWKRHREFWALQDISFEIEAGTTTGIIGPNGSGKSTLLQIITGTLEPTHGSVYHEGRIAALLELGAGFNPEFTGMENIFMNAALIGFSRSETEALVPEIERFAEIGPFIHQPVKTYSSGMYVRLAFSIAISASPRILIIDEALAVGDAVFQHRCTRRIREMQESGVTIFFVSHDPGAVRALCSRAILLNSGRIESDGKPADVLNHYQKLIMAREVAYDKASAAPDEDEADSFVDEQAAALHYTFRHGDGSAEVLSVELLDAAHRRVELVESGEPVSVRMRVRFRADVEDPVCGFVIRNRHGIHLYGTNTELQQVDLGFVRRGEVVEITFAFACWLAPDSYSVAVAAHSPDAVSFDWLDGALFFQVMSATRMDGVANLNATVTARRLGVSDAKASVGLSHV
ncbi:MAG TPA: ABC transporter ATP-binding protein [Pyrinomonadaceae bacterium]|nr:ABC transporter ATP-binding protein [Pyrinomonadaceae bacterium]